MDPRFPPETEAFRAQIRAFLAEHLPDEWAGIGALDTDDALEFTEHWREVLAENGYLAPAWPTRYGGGGLSKLQQVVMVEEFATYFKAPVKKVVAWSGQGDFDETNDTVNTHLGCPGVGPSACPQLYEYAEPIIKRLRSEGVKSKLVVALPDFAVLEA